MPPPAKTQVFFSYSSKDRGFAASLCDHLLVMGLNVWFDRREITAEAQAFTDEILKKLLASSISTSAAFLILLDDHSASSRWVEFEVGVAQARKAQDPSFKVIPITQSKPSSRLLPVLEHETSVDFSQGYKTALARLCQLLNADLTTMPRLGTQQAIASGSRSLQNGVPLEDHWKALEVAPERMRLLLAARALLSGYEEGPRVDDVVTIGDILDENHPIDVFRSGNLPLDVGEPGQGFIMGISFLPCFDWQARRLPSMNDYVSLVLLSVWPSAEAPGVNMSTLIAEYNQDGSAFLWFAHSGNLHRYTLGSLGAGSVLLSDRRKMGASPYAFQWPNNNPDSQLLCYRQALANKMGLGQVEHHQELPEPDGSSVTQYMLWTAIKNQRSQTLAPNWTQARGSAREIWEKLKADKWVFPEGSQRDILLGHIRYGGVFLYDVSPESSVTPILSCQLNHLLECAGAIIHRIPFSVGKKDPAQYLSVSSLQSEVLRPWI